MTAVKIRQEDIIACTPVESKKIYIREETGHFQKIRRYLNVVLVTLFVALPFIQYQGQQAILFDVGRQTLTLFAWVLYPQDLMIFAFLFILAAFVLFLVTRHYGRVWCGFTCPQTVGTLAFKLRCLITVRHWLLTMKREEKVADQGSVFHSTKTWAIVSIVIYAFKSAQQA